MSWSDPNDNRSDHHHYSRPIQTTQVLYGKQALGPQGLQQSATIDDPLLRWLDLRRTSIGRCFSEESLKQTQIRCRSAALSGERLHLVLVESYVGRLQSESNRQLSIDLIWELLLLFIRLPDSVCFIEQVWWSGWDAHRVIMCTSIQSLWWTFWRNWSLLNYRTH